MKVTFPLFADEFGNQFIVETIAYCDEEDREYVEVDAEDFSLLTKAEIIGVKQYELDENEETDIIHVPSKLISEIFTAGYLEVMVVGGPEYERVQIEEQSKGN